MDNWRVVGTTMGAADFRVKWDGESDPVFTVIGWKFDGPGGAVTPAQLYAALGRWIEAEGNRLHALPPPDYTNLTIRSERAGRE